MLGFGDIAVVLVELAKIVFFIAIALFLLTEVAGMMRGRSAPLR